MLEAEKIELVGDGGIVILVSLGPTEIEVEGELATIEVLVLVEVEVLEAEEIELVGDGVTVILVSLGPTEIEVGDGVTVILVSVGVIVRAGVDGVIVILVSVTVALGYVGNVRVVVEVVDEVEVG